MGELNTSIQYLQGVGPKRAELLKKELGIETLYDLIHIYPFRYMDRSGITPIAEIASSSASVQIKARIVSRTLYGPSGAMIDQSGAQIHFNACKRLTCCTVSVYSKT